MTFTTPSPSLFETEMRHQLDAAEEAVAEAARRGDTLLEQAARNHHESLLGLARRNGIAVGSLEPAVVTLPGDIAPDVPPQPEGALPA
jgi:hypothetical protein